MSFRCSYSSSLKLSLQFRKRKTFQECSRDIPGFQFEVKDYAEAENELLREFCGCGGPGGKVWNLSVKETSSTEATLDLVSTIWILQSESVFIAFIRVKVIQEPTIIPIYSSVDVCIGISWNLFSIEDILFLG